MLHGPAPTLIGRPGVAGLVARSSGVTVFELKLLTYAVVPVGDMAMAAGPLPTRIGVSRENDVDPRTIGVTVFESELVTYAIFPLGAMAMPRGPFNAGGAPWTTIVWLLAVLIAVTELRLRLVTYTVPVATPVTAPAEAPETIAGSAPKRRVMTGSHSARRIRRRPTEATGIFIATVARSL
jgi:hypothetical protein